MKFLFKIPIAIYGIGVVLALGVFSCKTLKLTKSELPVYQSIQEYLDNSTTQPNYRDPKTHSAYDLQHKVNASYEVNGNDIIEIYAAADNFFSTTTIDNLALYIRPTKVMRFSIGHPFFQLGKSKITLGDATEINLQFTIENLKNWGTISDKISSLGFTAKLLPRMDFKLYPGASLELFWNFSENFWPSALGNSESPPYNNNAMHVFIDRTGIISLPVVTNSTGIADTKADEQQITREKFRKYRSNIPQILAAYEIKDQNNKFPLLSTLNHDVNDYISTCFYAEDKVKQKYPQEFFIQFLPSNLSWTFTKTDGANMTLPFTTGSLLIESVSRIYKTSTLRKLKANACIYISVFPADESESPFSINIANQKSDLLIKPGDRVILSF